MLFLAEATAASPRFPRQFARGHDRVLGTGPTGYAQVGVIDSSSYRALLANLGLEPDPRLCVPAVRP
jgi:hypothetical protein